MHSSAKLKNKQVAKIEISNSKNKNLAPKCVYQKVGKILLLIFSYNIETNKVLSTLILLQIFGKLYIFNKMWFQEVYVTKMKISNFLQTLFFCITLTLLMIMYCILMIEFWRFGLCWPLLAFIVFLAFVTLDESFNSGSLGGSTESEPTQMEMFNFMWLIWDHCLPLTPTRNDWHPWHP